MCREPIIGAMDMPNDPRFPPDSPLPGAPDPWAASSAPPVRSGPPYIMDEMIAAEPALAERLFWLLGRADGAASRLAAEVKAAAAAGAPIVATGCGTSEHGAMAIAAILTDALRTAGRPASVTAAQAFEAALDPQDGGLLIGVSHEGGTAATLRAMDAARARGARVGLITVSERAPGAAHADVVVATDPNAVHAVKLGATAPTVLGSTAAGAAIGMVVGGPPGAAVGAGIGWVTERYHIGGGFFGKGWGKLRAHLAKMHKAATAPATGAAPATGTAPAASAAPAPPVSAWVSSTAS